MEVDDGDELGGTDGKERVGGVARESNLASLGHELGEEGERLEAIQRQLVGILWRGVVHLMRYGALPLDARLDASSVCAWLPAA